MKKILFSALIIIATLSTMTSCTAMLAATTDDEAIVLNTHPTVDFIISYGTPYYYGNVLEYYLWDGYYYYPNRGFFSRPLPPPRPYFNHRPRMGRPMHHWRGGRPNMVRPPRPQMGRRGYDGMQRRPFRSSTRMSQGQFQRRGSSLHSRQSRGGFSPRSGQGGRPMGGRR